MEESLPLIVVAPTFYADRMDLRYQLALELCREAAKLEIHLLLVDGSPDPQVQEELAQAGQGFVTVEKQKLPGKKGVALREGIAAAQAKAASDDTIIAFQEPEKIDMLRHWRNVVTHMQSTSSDICVPRRSPDSFQSSYPIEQYHSESFANLHLDSLAKQVNFPSIDWMVGPIALRACKACYWLDYDGELWDAQIVPMVLAQRWYGCTVSSLEVDFILPAGMKQQEEGVPKWGEKRLFQLNIVFETVGKALKDKEKP